MIKNLSLKILSVLIAASLWMVVATGEFTEVNVYAPVKLKNVRDGYVAVTEDPLVNVTVKAPGVAAKSLSYNDIIVEIDASEMRTGDIEYRIRFEDVKVSSGFDVMRVEPSRIIITVDKLVTKNIEVSPSFIGEPVPGYKVGSVRIKPANVTVTGAETKLAAIDYVETLPVNVSGRNKSVTFSTGIRKQEGIKSVSPEQVEVFVDFHEDIVEREMQAFPVEVRNLAGRLAIEGAAPSTTVTLRGRSDVLSSENLREAVNLFIDMSDATEAGVYRKRVSVEVKSGVEVLKIGTPVIRMQVGTP